MSIDSFARNLAAAALALGGGGGGTPAGSNGDLQINSSGVFGALTPGNNIAAALAIALGGANGIAGIASANTFTGANAFNAGLSIGGNISAASWGLTGLKLIGGGSTLTDTSGAGTVASGATDVLGGNTIAATNARTLTNYYSVWVKDPIAGTNVTLTNKWSLGLEGGLYVGAESRFDGMLKFSGASASFPALKRNGAGLYVRLADDSGYADLTVKNLTVTDTSITLGPGSASTLVSTGGNLYLGANAFIFRTQALANSTYVVADAANTLAMRNGTNAQRANFYNSWTDAANNEGYKIDWITTANIALVGPFKNGTGTQRVQRLSFLEDGGAGSTTPSLGTTCPAASATIKSWIKVITSDGTTGYVPCWA